MVGLVLLTGISRGFKEERTRRVLWDIVAVSVPLGMAFGRVGCWRAGCCGGLPIIGFPVQLVSAALDLLVWGILTIGFRLRGPDGLFAPRFLALYGMKRFFVGFHRVEDGSHLYGLDVFQIVGGLVAVGSMSCLVYSWFKRRHSEQRRLEE